MFVVLWEFHVKPGCEERFESVYGPSGEWVQLFRRDKRYRQTMLLHDSARERVYVTGGFWDSREPCDAFRKNNSEAYLALDKAGETLTTAERKIGKFEQVSADT
jgi:hypothetical protein